MYEDDLVGVGIFEEITLHAFLGGGEYNVTIIVHQHRYAGCQIVRCRRDAESFEAAMLQHPFLGDLRCHADRFIGGDDAGRRMTVIQQGIIIRKTFGAEKLFGIQASIRLAELGMTLVRDLSQAMIMGHGAVFKIAGNNTAGASGLFRRNEEVPEDSMQVR